MNSTSSVVFASHEGSKKNQDAGYAAILQRPINDEKESDLVYVAAVFDGHGHEGEECSAYCEKRVKEWVAELCSVARDWNTLNWEHIATSMTTQIHAEYRAKCAEKPGRKIINNVVLEHNDAIVHGGSTLSVAITVPNGTEFRTVCIQIGDSDIYINGKQVECNHSALNPEEWQRIQLCHTPMRCAYLLKNGKYMDVFREDGTFDSAYYKYETPENPWRWYNPNNTPTGIIPSCNKYEPSSYLVLENKYGSLAVTRSIADFWANDGGVSQIPTVTIVDTEKMPTVLVGSDGLFDTLNRDNLWISPTNGPIGHTYMTQLRKEHAQEDAVQFVHQAHELFKELFGKNKVDDVSMAVILP